LRIVAVIHFLENPEADVVKSSEKMEVDDKKLSEEQIAAQKREKAQRKRVNDSSLEYLSILIVYMLNRIKSLQKKRKKKLRNLKSLRL
jgi:ABC-type phosphate/phosphonate transport system substrate-binding protein